MRISDWSSDVCSSDLVAAEMARHAFDRLVEAGEASGIAGGLRLCGLHALDSLRIEKAYRHFGHDIGDEDHVLEAGLGFAVKTEKQASRFGPFIGRDAVLQKSEAGLTRRLLQVKLAAPQPLLHPNEPLWHHGRIAGHRTAKSLEEEEWG